MNHREILPACKSTFQKVQVHQAICKHAVAHGRWRYVYSFASASIVLQPKQPWLYVTHRFSLEGASWIEKRSHPRPSRQGACHHMPHFTTCHTERQTGSYPVTIGLLLDVGAVGVESELTHRRTRLRALAERLQWRIRSRILGHSIAEFSFRSIKPTPSPHRQFK